MPTSYAYQRSMDQLIRLSLEEDLPGNDITTIALIPELLTASAYIIAKEELVVSGLKVAQRVFQIIDPAVVWEGQVKDGSKVEAATIIVRLSGRAASLLAGERTALNFLQHLSGIATATRRVVDQVKGFPVMVMDTRKTTPGWRLLEKAAVRDGGGVNHRFSLSDCVLIKDNHVKLCGGAGAAVAMARDRLSPRTRIEVEVSSLEEVREVLDAGADVILLDNSQPQVITKAVFLIGERASLEVSGGITEKNIRAMAETGVRLISVGAITHSAGAVDISLEIVDNTANA